ncbi:MAG: hypothetical protein NTZ10_03995 [Candidatus Saganbacteria bacterium]|nr:hypothetical protein [Candidatus Saganbacteria bacterium]
MRGTLSPILSHLVKTTISAVGEKEKLNRFINKYRKMLRYVEGGINISEIRFGLADLLITRDDQSDWSEAKTHYDFVLEHAPYGYLRFAAMIGKAELAIRASQNKELDSAIELAQRSLKNLNSLVGPSDFYSTKCLVVEAELLIKRGAERDKTNAKKLFEKAYNDSMADHYFRGRAIVGRSEIMLYEKKKDVNKEIQLCHDAIDLLEEKSDDYFAIKAKLLQGEFIAQRMAHYDKSRATGIFMGIIGNKNADADLVCRAKLNLAEISDRAKALKLIKEVLSVKPLDPYLSSRAKSLGKAVKAKK